MERWQNPDIKFGSWWDFPSLDKKGGLHANNYHGQFIPQVAEQLILRYTDPGDTVLDLFLGSGTTAIECQRLGRRCLGVDLKAVTLPDVDDLAFLQEDSTSPGIVFMLEDACRSLGWALPRLTILHPPYHDIIKFSDDSADLSNQPDITEYLVKLGKVILNANCLTAETIALVMGDIYQYSQVIPLGFMAIELMKPWRLKAINVKNIKNTERSGSGGKMTNLWKYRAMKNGFNLFEHEYILVFRRK